MKRANPITIFLATLALLAYLGIVILAPIHVVHMAEMGMPMQNCPFAVGEHSLCAMNLFQHITVWQAFSNVLIPTLQILSLAVIVVLASWLWYYSPPLLGQQLYVKRQRSKSVISFYQELFSQGILNPKAP